MSVLYAAAAIALVIAALVLTHAMNAAYGAERVTPVPRCVAGFGGSSSAWVVCL